MFQRNTSNVASPQSILVIDHKTMTFDTVAIDRLDDSDRNGKPWTMEREQTSLKFGTAA